MIICFACETKNNITSISRNSECKKCQRFLRVCKNCIFYDMNAYNLCKESMADRQTEKERPNFCDYFKASDTKNIIDDKAKKSMVGIRNQEIKARNQEIKGSASLIIEIK